MQVFRIAEGRFLLRLALGEEMMGKLRAFADEHGIGTGVLRGIGAATAAELAIYKLDEKRYESTFFEETLEVTGVIGNLSRGEDGAPIPHVHATMSKADGQAIGGHVMSLKVGPTLEIDLEVMPGTMIRKLDPEIGLPLMAEHRQS